MSLQKFTAGIVAAIAISACAPDFDPPPDYKGGFLVDSDKSRTVTVQAGDSLYTISRRYDVPTKVIAGRNGLTAPYQLTTGQTLILDPTRVHVVAEGDTLPAVAQKYGVDQGSLIAANELTPPYRLRAGAELWIPDPFTNAALPQVASVDLPPISAAPRSSSAITSETLKPIGPPAGPSAEVLMPLPPTSAPGAPSEAPLSAPMATPPAPSMQAPAVAAIPTPPAPSVALPPPGVAPPRTALSEAPPPRASMRFAWPVTGKVVAKFGPAGKGLHNDGINIAVPAGTQVHAADNGVVAYAGNELKGFGNLLLIKHADGWTTAYAHNEKLLVARGDKVTQGQVIAIVGRTGNVDSPQLHFEVRKGTQAMDPVQFLEKAGG